MAKKLIAISFVFFVFTCCAQNKYVDSLKVILATRTNPMERFELINKIQFDYWISGNGDIDSANVMQMLDIALKLNNDSLRAISYDWIGEYYKDKNVDFPKSLEFFLKGIQLAEKVNDKFTLTILYADLNVLYSYINNAAEQLNYARKAEASLPDKSSPGYSYVLRQVYNAYANYYCTIPNTDSILHYYQAMNEINRSEKSPFWEAWTNDELGWTYGLMGDTTLSVPYFRKSIDLATLTGNFYVLSSCENDYSEYLVRQRRFEQAKEHAMNGFRISKEHKYNFWNRMSAFWLRRIYEQTNNPDSSCYYAKIESAVKDSIYSQEKMGKISGMIFSEQIRTKEEEAKKAAEREQHIQNIQYDLIAVGIITFVLLFLLLSRSVITNTKVIQLLGVMALLVVFEFLNLLLHPFLERITHHAPFLMLLALVCIAALLVPLHHRLEKWATHKLVEKNKQIRLAAAKKTIEKLQGNK